MTEKLIPFDLEAYKREPERLRYHNGDNPLWSGVVAGKNVGNVVVAKWRATANVYDKEGFHLLRLAAKTQKVKVWLVRDCESWPWQSVIRMPDDPRPTSWNFVHLLGEQEVPE